jgi:hypothetical protein
MYKMSIFIVDNVVLVCCVSTCKHGGHKIEDILCSANVTNRNMGRKLNYEKYTCLFEKRKVSML